MTRLALADLAACFEGVIPSIIATAAPDGLPNISYLSHVVRVDDDHVALSNQFFAKTAANIRANPRVTLILVDCRTGDQFLLDIGFVRSVDAGPLFDRIALQLKATSAQVGMAEVMRLRSADIFRVHAIERVPSPVETAPPAAARAPVSLPMLAAAARAIAAQADAEGVIDELLRAVRDVLGHGNAALLLHDGHRGCFVTTGSIGYDPSGLGSEIAGGDGLIGAAAESGQAIKVSDMSRVRRFGEAIATGLDASEEASRSIAFPELPMAMSQIAIPMAVRGRPIGVLFVESAERMAFGETDEAALELLAAQAAATLRASEGETIAAQPGRDAPAGTAGSGRPAFGIGAGPSPAPDPAIRVVHHRIDDSIFVDGTYIVKGIAGALLRLMLEWHLDDGRNQFTNREMRLVLGARMPDVRDNLETRLLLLRRRLDEKHAPIRITRIGRGRLRLETQGPVTLDAARE